MKKKHPYYQPLLRVFFFARRLLLSVCAAGLLGGCATVLEERQFMGGRSLSPNGKMLAFHYYTANPRNPGYGRYGPSLLGMLLGKRAGLSQVNESLSALGFYNIPEDEFSIVYPPPGTYYVDPSFSSDGKRVLFMIAEESRRSFAMLDLETMRYRIIRRGDGDIWSSRPVLSPDDRYVLFSVKEENNERVGVNLKEMEIESGEERWVVRYDFHYTLGRYYGADSDQILFWTNGRNIRYTGTGENFKSIDLSLPEPGMFLINARGSQPLLRELRPYITDDVLRNFGPGVPDWSGRIVFTAVSDDLDRQDGEEKPVMPGNPRAYWNYDIFIWERGEITRLTKRADLIDHPTWSAADGGRIVFQSDPRRDRRIVYWMMDGDGKNIREIKLPATPDGWRVLTMEEEK
jgi:hypothetical protein